MDFLGLRNLTVLDDALDNIEANRGSTSSSRPRPRRPGDLRPAGPGRHARRVPARRRADARPAALHAADNFEDISAVIALYRPGPMGANAHNDYADRKTGRKPVDADPPRARRAAGRDPRRHLRPDRLPGAGPADRAEAGRLLARQGRPAAQGDGQEEEGDPGQGVRAVRGRDEGQRLLRRSHQGALGHPGPVLRLRLQQGAHRQLRPGRLLDGLSQGELPGRVHGRAADLGRDDKDKSALYLGECRRMGIKVLPPDVNASDANFTPVGTDIRFGLAAIRNVGANVVESIVARGRPKGPSSTSATSCARWRPSSATSAPSRR